MRIHRDARRWCSGSKVRPPGWSMTPGRKASKLSKLRPFNGISTMVRVVEGAAQGGVGSFHQWSRLRDGHSFGD